MSERKLIALGTSSQVPTRSRNHHGAFMHWDEEGLLFDPGEGSQRQMIYANVAATDITKIFITHFHGDHCLGLAGILQRISLDRVAHPIEVYFPASGQVYFERLRDASMYVKAARIVPYPITREGTIFESATLRIETRKLDHSVEAWGYRFIEADDVSMVPERLEELGIRGRAIGELKRNGRVEHEGEMIDVADVSVHRPGQSFAFVMDTRKCENAIELARDVDLLICESTYLQDHEREAIDHGHLTARHAAQIAKAAGARLLVLTHFSQRYADWDAFAREAGELHENVVTLRDCEAVPFPKRRRASGEGRSS